jgi:D-ribose pyranose/furanose isomerase RbsD
MINSIKNNITTRKGFIIAVITLILFNFVFIGGYYTIHLSNEINDHHTEVREELTKEVDNLKKIISKSNTPQKELQQYAIKNNVTITITNDNNEIILTYKPNKKRKLGSDITV